MSEANVRPDTAPELENVDHVSAEAFRALHDVMRANGQHMARRFSAQHVPIGQLACLRMLATRDGITQRDMAEALHISRPSVTSMLQAAEKCGTVVRRPDEADQRLTRVYLTDEGRELSGKLGGLLGVYITETFGTMAEDDQRELTRLLRELETRIRAATTEESE